MLLSFASCQAKHKRQVNVTHASIMHNCSERLTHLRRFVMFVASYLVILSHSVCDFDLVISIFFSVISDFGKNHKYLSDPSLNQYRFVADRQSYDS